MKRVLILFLLTSLTITRTYSQNIYSALQHDRGEAIKGRIPSEIIEDQIFYNSTGKEIRKNKKILNSKGKILLEERYNQTGSLEARLTYSYDSSGLYSLTRKFERWTNLGYSSETAFYEYDRNWYLTRVTDKTQKGNTIQETVLTNNEKGNPIKLILFDGNGKIYGSELATYDYKGNKAYTVIQDSKGNLIPSDTLTINFEIPLTGNKYNDNGDVIESEKYFYEYEYDEFGNWTIMKIFKNVRGKRKIDRVFKRRFKYDG